MTPVFELLLYFGDRSFVALVYEIDVELLVRDVAIFELFLNGKFEYVGVGVFGNRFVPVGKFPKFLRPMIDAVLKESVK